MVVFVVRVCFLLLCVVGVVDVVVFCVWLWLFVCCLVYLCYLSAVCDLCCVVVCVCLCLVVFTVCLQLLCLGLVVVCSFVW